MGIDEIPLDLLQHQKEDDEPECPDRVHHKDHESTDSASYEAPNMGISAVKAMSTPTRRA